MKETLHYRKINTNGKKRIGPPDKKVQESADLKKTIEVSICAIFQYYS